MKLRRSTGRYLRLFMAVMLALSVVPLPALGNTMLPSAPLPTGRWPKGVALGDVDGDGDNDIVTANYGTSDFTVFLQQADGVLGAPVSVGVEHLLWSGGTAHTISNPASVQIAEVTGDDVNEILLGDTFYQVIHVYKYNGAGWEWIYAIPANQSAGGAVSTPFDFAIGDANMDGQTDMLVPMFFKNPVFNDGNKMLDGDNGGIHLLKQYRPFSLDLVSVDSWQDNVLAGSVQGVVRLSCNSGSEWVDSYPPREAERGIRDIEFADHDTAWAVGDGFIMSTTNAGFSWTQPIDSDTLNSISVADGFVAAAVGDAGSVYFTTKAYDDYATWTRSSVPEDLLVAFGNEGPDLYGVSFPTRGPGWAVGEAGVALRLPNATTMTAVPMPVPRDLYAVDVHDSGRICAVGENGTVFVSDDRGQNWRDTSVGGDDLMDVDFATAAVGCAVGEGGRVLRTTDRGGSWTESFPTGSDLNAVHFSNDGTRVWAVGDGDTILFSEDAGLTWSPQTSFTAGWGHQFTYYEGAFNPYSAVIADLNGDGKNDLGAAGYVSGTFIPQFLTGWNYPWETYFNAPTFMSVSLGGSPRDCCVGDVNNDGLNDVASIDYDGAKLSVALQNSTHRLVNPQNDFILSTGKAPVAIDIGDVTGDGLNDVVVTNSYNPGSSYQPRGSVGIFVQNPEGKLDAMREIPLGKQPYGVVIGNVDGNAPGDSGNEIVVTNSADHTLQILNYGPPLEPTVASPSHPDQDTYYRATTASFELSAPADFDGIEGFYYRVDRSPSTVPTGGAEYTTRRDIKVSLATLAQQTSQNVEGDWYFHAVCYDRVGHRGTRATHYRVRIDTSPPTVPVVTDSVDGWTTYADRTFTWPPCTDTRSGLDRYYVSMNGGPETSTTVNKYSVENLRDGTNRVSVRARDKAGNYSDKGEHIAYVDVGSPTVSITKPASGAWLAGIYYPAARASDAAGISSVTFKVDGITKAVDTVAPYEFRLDTRTLANGSHILSVEARDMVDRVASASRTFYVDNVKPTITSIAETPDPFYPVRRDGYKDYTNISYKTSERATLKLQINDSGGNAWRRMTYSKPAGTNVTSWDGKSNSGKVKTGKFHYRLIATDRAGNTTYSLWYSVTIRDYEFVRLANNQVRIVPR